MPGFTAPEECTEDPDVSPAAFKVVTLAVGSVEQANKPQTTAWLVSALVSEGFVSDPVIAGFKLQLVFASACIKVSRSVVALGVTTLVEDSAAKAYMLGDSYQFGAALASNRSIVAPDSPGSDAELRVAALSNSSVAKGCIHRTTVRRWSAFGSEDSAADLGIPDPSAELRVAAADPEMPSSAAALGVVATFVEDSAAQAYIHRTTMRLGAALGAKDKIIHLCLLELS